MVVVVEVVELSPFGEVVVVDRSVVLESGTVEGGAEVAGRVVVVVVDCEEPDCRLSSQAARLKAAAVTVASSQ